ncbi:glycosyltransferase, partial [Gulbenkiania mobilis]|uniref:glycosyltransferase n=1 Tax=Gulbenkiania mobilis TaxID=397457 RepID=UPI000ACC8A75
MISVVIGINKVDRFTYAAIDSIICQTLKEIELVIVANGAEYESVASELESKYQTFSNVMIYKTPIGQLAYALNKGIELARFDLIARMDSDDISHPDRLSQQLKFMIEKNLDLVGCDINLIDEKDKLIGKRCYPKGNEINKLLPFRNPFAHNTI